jgi:hypothetical protein
MLAKKHLCLQTDDQKVKSAKKPPVSKGKQKWNEKLDAATTQFEMDRTFLSLSTGAVLEEDMMTARL